jgi:hypothetical protein
MSMILQPSKMELRNYALLALALICTAPPSRADTMTVTKFSLGSSGTLVAPGFDSSLGTLTQVDLSAEAQLELIFEVFDAATLTDESAVIDQSLTLPDGSTIKDALRFTTDISGPLAPPDVFTPVFEANYFQLFLDPGTLGQFLGPSVSIGFSGESGVSSPAAVPNNVVVDITDGTQVTLTYTYTPTVAAVPEPSAVFLLGGAAALCIWRLRKRLALRNG